MRPSAIFHENDEDRLAALVAERGLALIVGAQDDHPLIAHAPVVWSPGRLRFHLSAANPLGAVLSASRRAMAVVTGPDAYISPDWYAAADQVPTWNYVSVEMEGAVRVLSGDETATLLDDLSAHFEARLAPKAPWTRAKMSPGKFDAMLRAIIGFEMTLERMAGTSKLSQNKPEAEIARVAAALAERPDEGSRLIAKAMAARSRRGRARARPPSTARPMDGRY